MHLQFPVEPIVVSLPSHYLYQAPDHLHGKDLQPNAHSMDVDAGVVGGSRDEDMVVRQVIDGHHQPTVHLHINVSQADSKEVMLQSGNKGAIFDILMH